MSSRDDRTLDEKLADMAARGTPNEREIAARKLKERESKPHPIFSRPFSGGESDEDYDAGWDASKRFSFSFDLSKAEDEYNKKKPGGTKSGQFTQGWTDYSAGREHAYNNRRNAESQKWWHGSLEHYEPSKPPPGWGVSFSGPDQGEAFRHARDRKREGVQTRVVWRHIKGLDNKMASEWRVFIKRPAIE